MVEWEAAGPSAVATALELLTDQADRLEDANMDEAWSRVVAQAEGFTDGG